MDIKNTVDIGEYLPEFVAQTREFKEIIREENKQLNIFSNHLDNTIDNNYIQYSDEYGIARIEKFLKIKPLGTLSQRKDFLRVLYLNGNKTNKTRIEEIIKNVTGGKAIIKFWAEDESGNLAGKQGYLEIKVLSPDISKDYNFSNLERLIRPLIAAHIKLSIKKWFATWNDLKESHANWEAVKNSSDWECIYSFIPTTENI